MFPQMPKVVVDLLNRTMTFDPRSRASVEEALEHEFFSECRRKEVEFTRKPLEMEFEVGEENLTLENLKQYFKKELIEYYQWFLWDISVTNELTLHR